MLYYSQEARKTAQKDIDRLKGVIMDMPNGVLSYTDALAIVHRLQELEEIIKKEEKENTDEAKKQKRITELRLKRHELLKKKDEAEHAPDPFGSNNRAILAAHYKQEADKVGCELCELLGLDPVELGYKD